MPNAIPLPRGPSRLVLFGVEDLLCVTGCPVCRYVAEAGDRFLGWFALEGHAEADMITRLCRSLGLCPAHTRALLGPPGAEGRMTAVCRYLLRAAAGFLAPGSSSPTPCPACEHAAEAEKRALDTLLTGLSEDSVREHYRDADGLCLPHLRAAAPRGRRRPTAWLAGEMIAQLADADGPRALAVIAGDREPDADIRVRLRAALPAGRPRSGDLCSSCLAAALAERAALARPNAGLCPEHLHEACSAAAGGGQGPLSSVAARALTLNPNARPRDWPGSPNRPDWPGRCAGLPPGAAIHATGPHRISARSAAPPARRPPRGWAPGPPDPPSAVPALRRG
jgi:hypothetical protein